MHETAQSRINIQGTQHTSNQRIQSSVESHLSPQSSVFFTQCVNLGNKLSWQASPKHTQIEGSRFADTSQQHAWCNITHNTAKLWFKTLIFFWLVTLSSKSKQQQQNPQSPAKLQEMTRRRTTKYYKRESRSRLLRKSWVNITRQKRSFCSSETFLTYIFEHTATNFRQQYHAPASMLMNSQALWNVLCELTWNTCTRIHKLSTPTARTRNGTTSMMISVAFTPMYDKRPKEEPTAQRTITTPARPSEIFESICKQDKRMQQ